MKFDFEQGGNFTPEILSTTDENIARWHNDEGDCVDFVLIFRNGLKSGYEKLWQDKRYKAGAIRFEWIDRGEVISWYKYALTFKVGVGKFVLIELDSDLVFCDKPTAIKTLNWLLELY